ncbi:MAG: hypothetical protein ABIE70_04290 [bacterium]
MRLVLLLVLLWGSALAQPSALDADDLINAILAAEQAQRAAVVDVVYDAELIEGEDKDGQFVEKDRFVKTVYVRYEPDTSYFAEEYLQYYHEGELQDSTETAKQAADRYEKKQKRNAKDVSWPMLRPFRPDMRERYEISYQGLDQEEVPDFTCHHFRVMAREKDEELINGDFYFETESFHLARVDFSPSKLTKKTMFKMSRLDMTMICAPTAEGWWLPTEFHIAGQGKAMFLIGVSFEGTEYYRNPQINTGLSGRIFEDYHGDH